MTQRVPRGRDGGGYREADAAARDADRQRRDAERKLDALAEAGRRRARSAGQDAERRRELQRAASPAKLRERLTPFAASGAVFAPPLAYVLPALALAVLAALGMLVAGKGGSAAATALWATGMGAWFAGFALVPLIARVAAARERTFIASLPFPVEGYFDALATRALIVGLRFDASCDELATSDLVRVKGLLGNVAVPIGEGDGTLDAKIAAGVLTISVDRVLDCDRLPRAWLRAVIEQVLVPLHALRPIKQAAVSCDAIA